MALSSLALTAGVQAQRNKPQVAAKEPPKLSTALLEAKEALADGIPEVSITLLRREQQARTGKALPKESAVLLATALFEAEKPFEALQVLKAIKEKVGAGRGLSHGAVPCGSVGLEEALRRYTDLLAAAQGPLAINARLGQANALRAMHRPGDAGADLS